MIAPNVVLGAMAGFVAYSHLAYPGESSRLRAPPPGTPPMPRQAGSPSTRLRRLLTSSLRRLDQSSRSRLRERFRGRGASSCTTTRAGPGPWP